MTLVPAAEFEARLRNVRYSARRIETLQVYKGSGEDDAIAAFEVGAAAPPPDPAQDEWDDMLRGFKTRNILAQRFHVVTEPLTPYMAFELCWAYWLNHRAGESIFIVDATCGWPTGVPRRDVWLLDSTELYLGLYEPDGTWLGLHAVTEPAEIVAACRGFDAALHHSVPWEDYVAARPALKARLPVVATA